MQLLIDRNAAAGALVERSRAQGVVEGTGDGLRLGLAAGGRESAGLDQVYARAMPAPPARVDPADFVRLAAATSIPLAHGERELTRFTVRDFIASGAIRYVQFDSTRAAGFTEGLRVAALAEQHAVMIEAVENHMPEVIVIDEIGTELEAAAARTIAERGVQLVATAHGNTLENLMLNPTLTDLVGGIQTVTLSDEEARRRGTQKSVLERKAPPTFQVL